MAFPLVVYLDCAWPKCIYFSHGYSQISEIRKLTLWILSTMTKSDSTIFNIALFLKTLHSLIHYSENNYISLMYVFEAMYGCLLFVLAPYIVFMMYYRNICTGMVHILHRIQYNGVIFCHDFLNLYVHTYILSM